MNFGMHKHYNGLKTAALFGVMWVIILGIGGIVAQSVGNSSVIWLFLLFGLVTTFMTYWNSDKLAIKSMSAVEVSEQEQPRIYAIVRELSQKAGKPMPRIYVAPTASPNAFATGRNPSHAAVCCTQGILNLLDDRELRGVLAHELMHVYNRDILTSSIASAAAGVITSVAQIVSFSGSNRNRNNAGLAILLPFLAPFAASMIQMMISRTREYDADEDGAKLSGDPMALASALKKLEVGTTQMPLAQSQQLANTSHMMIANPFGSMNMQKMFSTHPPMLDRIARLQQLNATMAPAGVGSAGSVGSVGSVGGSAAESLGNLGLSGSAESTPASSVQNTGLGEDNPFLKDR